MPVAFIVATSAIVGRVPGAVSHGLDSPEWRSLRNILFAAGGLFVLQQLIGPLHFTCGLMLAWRIDAYGGIYADLFALQASAYATRVEP